MAKKEIKTAIMKTVIEKAGPATDAGAIVFSLPVSEVEGFRKEDNDTESSDEIKEKEQS